MTDRIATATVRRRVRMPLRLADGEVVDGWVHTFDGLVDGQEHLVVALGETAAPVPLVRVHSECLTGDVLGSARCDCGPQLAESLERLNESGRGIGLYNKIDAYALQDGGLDTFEANEALGFGHDERSYAVAARMLHALGVDRIVLLSNNPDKAGQLRAAGIAVDDCVPTGLHLSPVNHRYLAAKAGRGHRLLGLVAVPATGS